MPRKIPDEQWEALNVFGGFPEPFANGTMRFLRKWRTLRMEQLLREDIRDITKSVELDQIESLALILANRSGEQLVMAPLACEVMTSEPTVKKWIAILKALYYGFTVKPYYKNIENSIRKTPKWYLRDWSGIEDTGKRAETFVACHLLKAVEGWADLGFGEFDPFFTFVTRKNERSIFLSRATRNRGLLPRSRIRMKSFRRRCPCFNNRQVRRMLSRLYLNGLMPMKTVFAIGNLWSFRHELF